MKAPKTLLGKKKQSEHIEIYMEKSLLRQKKYITPILLEDKSTKNEW